MLFLLRRSTFVQRARRVKMERRERQNIKQKSSSHFKGNENDNELDEVLVKYEKFAQTVRVFFS